MTGNFVSDVSGREDEPAVPEMGSALQKSWTILLERKVKTVLVEHKAMVKVERVQQPINGQWLLVVNGTIVLHRPGKTITSIFRADNDVTAETIRESCFTNLIDADKPSARVKNETQLFAMLIAEVDKDNGIGVEPVAETNLAQELADKLSVRVEVLNAVAEKLGVTFEAISKMDVIATAALVRMCNAVSEPEPKMETATDTNTSPVAAFLDKMAGEDKPRRGIKRRGKSPNEFARQPAVAEVAETEKENGEPDAPAVPFGPLLKHIDDVVQFKRLDCMLVEAVDTQGQYVEWAVNVYVPISEMIDDQLEVVEQLHLFTIIDEHTRGDAEHDLADTTYAPMAIRLDADEMRANNVRKTLEEFFDAQRPTASMSSAENGEMAFLQDEIGIPDTSVNIMANMMAPIRRQSVRVEQTCKHPSAAVRNALSRFKLKTIYFGRVSPE